MRKASERLTEIDENTKDAYTALLGLAKPIPVRDALLNTTCLGPVALKCGKLFGQALHPVASEFREYWQIQIHKLGRKFHSPAL